MNEKLKEITESRLSKHLIIMPYSLGNTKILNSKNMTSGTKLVLGLICTFNALGMSLTMSNNSMADELGISKQTVIHSVDQLQRMELITVKKITTKHGYTKGKVINLNFDYLVKKHPIHRTHKSHIHKNVNHKKHSTFKNDMIYLLRKLLRRLEK